MKVLGIVCSPRSDGNTARIVESILDGARNRGAETQIIYFDNLKVNPCRVCDSCSVSGKCAQEDDMQPIYEAIDGINAIVFGTPIYHDHVSAQAKALTDRLYAYEWKNSFPKGVKAVAVITYEWNNPRAYGGVLKWIKATFERYYQVKTVATLKAYDTRKRPVGRRPELLSRARAIGERLVV